MIYKPRMSLILDVPKMTKQIGPPTESIALKPRPIEATWTRNNHLVADELRVSIGWKEGGVDPRLTKNAVCAFYMWDSNREDFDQNKHLRFTGICKKATRKIMENGWVVELSFHDYTTLFIKNKPLKTSGLPNYSDTLKTIWERICDNTGWTSPDNEKIISSVERLKKRLVFRDKLGAASSKTLGDLVNHRFHAVAKPTPKHGASSWDVWQWVCGSLGLITYIDKDECIVTDSGEFYKDQNAARAIYGQNIHSLDENADCEMTSKGILLKSFDHLTGQTIESFYPRPGDERLKTKRAAVGKKSEGGTTVTANEVSGDYEEYNRFDITNQKELDACCAEAYAERSRQELEGSFKTAEWIFYAKDGSKIDILDLKSGDSIAIETDPGLKDTLRGLAGGEAAQIQYLVDVCEYDPDVAEVVVRNLDVDALSSPLFHVRSLECALGPESWGVTMNYHNKITTTL